MSSIITPGVQAVIFDFGGVLIDIDYHRVVAAFRELGVPDFDQMYSQAKQTGLFDAFEIGKLSPLEFCEEIRLQSGLPLTNDQITAAWNAIIIGMPRHREALVKKVAEITPVFLLSNTNQIHEDFFSAQLLEQFGYNPLTGMFNTVYLSHRIGKRKPEADAFFHVLDSHNLKPESTLFIDDSLQHIQGAQSVGLITHHLHGHTIESVL
jgi:putative hydrolase of the HAD superfamily